MTWQTGVSVIMVGITVFFAYIAFSLDKESEHWPLRVLFFGVSMFLALATVNVGIEMSAVESPDISSNLETIYGALVWITYFVIAWLIVYLIIKIGNWYSNVRNEAREAKEQGKR